MGVSAPIWVMSQLVRPPQSLVKYNTGSAGSTAKLVGVLGKQFERMLQGSKKCSVLELPPRKINPKK